MKELSTGDILLRHVRVGDKESRLLYGYTHSLAKMTGSGFHLVNNFKLQDAIDWYDRVKIHPCKWIIDYKNICIGTISLKPIRTDNKAKLAIEIYDESLHGIGIGYACLKLVLNYGFYELDYHKIYLRVLDYNQKAISLYEKVGFLYEGCDKEGAYINGKYHSDFYYSILKRDYMGG